MKLLWVAFSKFENSASGITSPLASSRYRVLMPMEYLRKRNHHVCLEPIMDCVQDTLMKNLMSNVVIFSKASHPISGEIARVARKKGARLIMDVCDNHFEHPLLGQHYRDLLKLVDAVTCSSEALMLQAQRFTSLPCHVIGDPYEGTRQPPAFAPTLGQRIKLVWFGFAANLNSITEACPSLVQAAQQNPLSLNIVTKSVPELDVDNFCQRLREATGNTFPITFTPWSLPAQQQAIKEADLVIIPSTSDGSKQAKSSNRMVESLLAGRMVVAHSIPAYDPFSDWAWIGNDLAEGISWVLEHASEIPDRIERAQEYIDQHYSIERIGAEWEHVVTNIRSAKRWA